MVRVAELSGGNPFFALELARAVDVGHSPSVFPSSLRQVVQAHGNTSRNGMAFDVCSNAGAAASTWIR